MKPILLVAGLSLLIATGCSKDAPKPKTATAIRPVDKEAPAVQAAPAQQEAVKEAVKENQGGGLNISAEIRQLCPGIGSPKFGFDSSELRNEWTAALSKLSECMKSGKLVGRSLLLTGHTDPRGDDDYNMNLGGHRAESVKSAITTFGVGGDRLTVTSRGEVDARGTDEPSWAEDRRVDIDLLKPTTSSVSAR